MEGHRLNASLAATLGASISIHGDLSGAEDLVILQVARLDYLKDHENPKCRQTKNNLGQAQVFIALRCVDEIAESRVF